MEHAQSYKGQEVEENHDLPEEARHIIEEKKTK